MSVLRTRLFKPPVNEGHVVRNRLLAELARHASKPFILVCAPAGYGKSVLVSQWLEQQRHKYMWISLDESIDNFHKFLEYLVEALDQTGAMDTTELRILLRGQELISPEALVEYCINHLAEIREPVAWAIDDYHAITDPDIHALIGKLVDYPIPGLQLILITRREPPLPLTQLRSYDKIYECTADDLSFHVDEINALTETLGVEHVETDIQALYAFTEGWVLGIKMMLASKSASGRLSAPGALRVPLNSAEFFFSELVEAFTAEEVRGLCIASLCDRFNGDLLDVVFQSNHIRQLKGDQFIQLLKRQNVFIIQQDQDQYWYRLHHFIQEVLREHSSSDSSSDVRQLHLSICGWFEDHDLIEEAIDYAVRARKFDRAIEIIETHRFALLDQDKWWLLQRWLDLLPNEIRKRSLPVLLTQLWVYEDTFQTRDVPAIIGIIEGLLEEQNNDVYHKEFHYHQAWYNLIILSEAEKAIFHLEQCDGIMVKSQLCEVRRQLYLALARQMIFGWEKACAPLTDAETAQRPKGLMYLRLQLAKMFIHLTGARFREADEVSREFLFLAKDSTFNATRAYSWYMRGNTTFQAFEKKESRLALEEAIKFRGVLNYRVYIDAFAGWAILRSLSMEMHEALDALKELQAFVSKLQSPRMLEYLESIHHRVLWHHGNAKPMLPWATKGWRLPLPSETFFAMDIPELTKARIALTYCPESQIDYGLEYLEEIENTLHTAHNRCSDIDILVGKAIAFDRKQEVEKVSKVLSKIVELVVARQQFRPLIEFGLVAPQLIPPMDLSELPRSIQRTLQVNKRFTPLSHIMSANLSSKEIAILELMAQGSRNKQIADELHLTEGTVKGYVHKIYRKIGAKNRPHAISLFQSFVELKDSQ